MIWCSHSIGSVCVSSSSSLVLLRSSPGFSEPEFSFRKTSPVV